MRLPTPRLPTSSIVSQEADVMVVAEAAEADATLVRATVEEMVVANVKMATVANEYIW